MDKKQLDAARVATLAATLKAITLEVVAENIGRADVVKATLLSLVSGKPAFFLGSPGVNKTGTVEALARRIVGANFYDALMPTIVSAEQLLVESTSIEETPTSGGGKSIRTHDTLGRAAAAHVLFADEIWKGDPRVLQTVLDLAKGDGVRSEGQMVATPLLAFLAASNELPEEGGNLGALWSRMTLRVRVNPLDRAGKTRLVAARLARQPGVGTASAKLTLAEVDELRAARPQVVVDQSLVETVLAIYEQLLKDHDDGSFQWLWDDDRRFGRVFDVLQAHALLHGRTSVSKPDLAVLAWMLWDTPEQIGTVEQVLAPYLRTPASEAKELIDALFAAGGAVKTAFDSGQANSGATNAMAQVRELAERTLPDLAGKAGGTEQAQIQAWISAMTKFKSMLAQRMAGIDVGTWEDATRALN